MPFNGDTYRANLWARKAREQIAQAKEIKARAAKGLAYDWEIERIPLFAQWARQSMRSSLFWRGQREIMREFRRKPKGRR